VLELLSHTLLIAIQLVQPPLFNQAAHLAKVILLNEFLINIVKTVQLIVQAVPALHIVLLVRLENTCTRISAMLFVLMELMETVIFNVNVKSFFDFNKINPFSMFKYLRDMYQWQRLPVLHHKLFFIQFSMLERLSCWNLC